MDRPTCDDAVCSMGYRVCREYSTAVDLSLLVVECAMERALDIVGQRLRDGMGRRDKDIRDFL